MPHSMDEYRDYLRLVARCFWHPVLQSRLDLSDVVQRTLLLAHENDDGYRGSTDSERKHWLRKILHNVIRGELRRKHLPEVSIDESSRCLEQALAAEHTPPSQAVLRDEQLQRLATALAQLPEDERTAVELKHLHGCSVAFISEYLGRTRQGVSGLLKRGLRRLRDKLGESS